MEYECEKTIRNELSGNERMVWYGRPKQGIVFRSSDAFMIPFSLLWGGFAIVWETSAILGGAPLFFCIFGVPFVVIGLYIIFGRFIVDAKQRERIYYGVSTERVIIISGLFNKRVKSLNIKTLSDISLTEKSNKFGTITFGPTNFINSWYAGASWPGMGNITPSFELIPNAKEVYNQIREIQNEK